LKNGFVLNDRCIKETCLYLSFYYTKNHPFNYTRT